MPLLAWRHVAAMLAAPVLLGTTIARAAPAFTLGGDGAFRNITATGGALPGVDVSGALVQANGSSTTMAALALEAANAVPLAMAGQPNGWLKLDGNGLVPAASIPASALSGIDPVARSTAATAAAAAAAAVPASTANRAGGFAQLDSNALVPLSLLPSSVTSPADTAARAQASAAQSAASAAQALAANAMPSSLADKAGGFAQLDSNALVPLSLLPSSVTSPTDAVARAQAGAAQSVASAAQALAAAAIPASVGGKAGGFAQLDGNGLIPAAVMPKSGIAAGACVKATFDPTGRATSCAALTGKDIPADGSSIGVDANGNLTALGGAGVDPTARTAAANAVSVANAAIPTSQIGVTVPGLDAARSLSQSLSAAAADATQRTFAQHWNDTINAADYGVDCDAGIAVTFTGNTSSSTITSRSYVFGPDDVGRPLKGGYYWGPWRATITGYGPVVNGVSSATVSTPPNVNAANDAGYMTYVTDNSAAMQRVYQHYLNAPKGAMVSWPIGKCDFSQPQSWVVSKPLRFSGMGIGATQFVMTAPNADAFHFLVGGPGNKVDITLDDFTISKSDPNNAFSQGTRFANKALDVEAYGDVGQNAGILVASHIQIQGQDHDDTSHGWNVGLEVNSFARPVIEYVNVKNGGVADGWNGAYANAPNPLVNGAAAIPAAILPGNGDDFWIHGTASNNGSVAAAEAAGATTVPMNAAGLSVNAGDTIEDASANVILGIAYSVINNSIVFNATTAAAAASSGATTVSIAPNGSNLNLTSGLIVDVTTGNALGTGTVSGSTVTFPPGGIASPVAASDVLSSGIAGPVSSGDQLANSSSYAIDTAFEHNGSDGGNVGLDIEDFQGGYVTDYDAVYGGYEIRSEHNDADSLPELMEIEDSLFNGFVMDIDLNGVGWLGLSNNDMLHSFTSPFFQAVWNHGGGLWTISGNQFSAPNQASASGVAFTADGPDPFGGFPETVSGNVGFSFSGTCLYTDSHYSAVIATGNSFEGCGTYVTDANGNNDYANNIFQYPTMLWTPATGTEFPNKVLVGTYANAGSLTIQDFPTNFVLANQFVLDSSVGTMTEAMNSTHADAWGGFFGYGGPGTLVLATGTSSKFPPLTKGNAEIFGRLFCANASAYMASWSVLGHYGLQGTPAIGGPSGAGVFTPDSDGDTTYAIGGTSPRFSLTPQLLQGASPGVAVVIGNGTPNASCTADLKEMIAQ